MFFIFRWLFEIDYFKQHLTHNIAPYIFLFVTFASPYNDIWVKTYKPVEQEVGLYGDSYYLRDAARKKNAIGGYAVLSQDKQHLVFYISQLAEKRHSSSPQRLYSFGAWR